MLAEQYIIFQVDPPPINDRLLNRMNQEENVEIMSRRWKNENMKQVCPIIQEWKSLYFWFECNKSPTILRQIQHIQFTNIQLLNLHNNGIDSIEGLDRINMRTLQSLSLHRNYITKIRVLNKLHLPDLEQLRISQNKIRDVGTLQTIKFPNLYTLSLDFAENYEAGETYKTTGQSINWVMKYQKFENEEGQQILQELYLRPDRKVPQQRAYQVAENRRNLPIIPSLD